MSESWAKMPCRWQTSASSHETIGASDRGEAIAALKLYVALCVKANFQPRIDLPETGCVQRSITQLCGSTGLSRPMVIRGLRKLQAWGLVDCKGGRPLIYHITDYETARYWTKLPRTHLYGAASAGRLERIALMPNRNATTLHGLQLYLYVASIRSRMTNEAKVTYERITAVLGIDRNQVSKAISVLVGHDLISVRLGQTDEFSTKEFPSNIYWLNGSISDDGRRQSGGQRAEQEGVAA